MTTRPLPDPKNPKVGDKFVTGLHCRVEVVRLGKTAAELLWWDTNGEPLHRAPRIFETIANWSPYLGIPVLQPHPDRPKAPEVQPAAAPPPEPAPPPTPPAPACTCPDEEPGHFLACPLCVEPPKAKVTCRCLSSGCQECWGRKVDDVATGAHQRAYDAARNKPRPQPRPPLGAWSPSNLMGGLWDWRGPR